MNITFGIISIGGNEKRINLIIASILRENIPEFEVIVVGGNINRGMLINIPQLKVINFNENLKPKPWISKKKNIININARYDIVVFMHDYVYLNEGWYKSMVEFGTDWDICMNKILNPNGTRANDWITARAADDFKVWNVRAPYDYDKTWKMYVSGSYWISKKYVLEKYPIDENRLHSELEDVEWSTRWNRTLNYKVNPNAKVQFMIHKEPYVLYSDVDTSINHMGIYSSQFQINTPEYEHGLDPGFDKNGTELPYKRRKTWWENQYKMVPPPWYQNQLK